MRSNDPCPCGSADVFGSCCLPLHVGERLAETAEALMRARYSGYAVRDQDFLWRTWHPRTRPTSVSTSAETQWVGLEIVGVKDGQPGDESGVVEFRAHHRSGGQRAVLHERSRFAVRARRWYYVDGDIDPG